METVYEKLYAVRNGDKNARDTFIEENMGLIWSIVRRFSNRGYDPQEIFQVGSIGLIKAVDKFDESFGVCFSTYAVPLIIGEIKRFLRDDSMLHVSRSLKETAYLAKKLSDDMQKKTGKEPNIKELSNVLGIEKEEIAIALASTNEVDSLYKTVYEKDGSSICLLDHLELEKTSEGTPEDIVDSIVLENSLKDLPKDEEEFIRMRYFEDLTQTKIASILGMSQVQVSRMEKKILKKLKVIIQGEKS